MTYIYFNVKLYILHYIAVFYTEIMEDIDILIRRQFSAFTIPYDYDKAIYKQRNVN
jgi:hypothetical protein